MKILVLIETIVILLFGAIIFAVFIELPLSNKELFTSCETENTYCLSVIRQQYIFNSREIILIHKEDSVSFGYSVAYPETNRTSAWDLNQLQILWQEDQIEVIISTNNTLVIPKQN